MKRHANAHWEGGLKDGKGFVAIQSGVLNAEITLDATLK